MDMVESARNIQQEHDKSQIQNPLMTYDDNSHQETEGVRADQKQKFKTMMEQITFKTVQEKRFV